MHVDRPVVDGGASGGSSNASGSAPTGTAGGSAGTGGGASGDAGVLVNLTGELGGVIEIASSFQNVTDAGTVSLTPRAGQSLVLDAIFTFPGAPSLRPVTEQTPGVRCGLTVSEPTSGGERPVAATQATFLSVATYGKTSVLCDT